MEEKQQIFVPYLRVSTEGQGLGLQGQLKVISKRIEECGGVSIHEPFVDRISGKEDESKREGLNEAIKYCKITGATLIVQALDRLSRDLSDSSRICFKEGISVVACDMSEDAMNDPVVFGVYAGIAQREREKIAGRIKRSVSMLKDTHLPVMAKLHAEGRDEEGEQYWLIHKSPRSRVTYQDWIRKDFKLGTPRNFTEEETKEAAQIRRESADHIRNETARDEIDNYLANHPMKEDRTLRKIADYLNKRHIKTPRGKEHGAKSVQLICRRYDINWIEDN